MIAADGVGVCEGLEERWCEGGECPDDVCGDGWGVCGNLWRTPGENLGDYLVAYFGWCVCLIGFCRTQDLRRELIAFGCHVFVLDEGRLCLCRIYCRRDHFSPRQEYVLVAIP